MAKTLIERIENLVMRDPNSGCWLWTGTLNNRGYGMVGVQGKMQLVHRTIYELFKGSIPLGLQLDHKCRTSACANPDHLEPVTNRENTMRGLSPETMRKHHMATLACPQGHFYTPKNTYIYFNKKGHRCRGCRICRRAVNRAWKARQP